ncbi:MULTISPECIES: acyl carrier protein [Pseudomonas]|uniref:acyl carrier protein n=1 Tax=Pseudomonas TaxID=286 RepID=UPI000D857AB7|nr:MULTISPECIES: phosphopantetheine-binding protein [Pseudomonas]MBD0678770.1 acyl carrier protein [Pseudomonas sp. PSB11]MCK8682423.1 phosphopantetheine-binding protein [Pseudomonas umsongensis]MDI3393202.1 phosphopantetheine-binding protein [Pseudomonas sp. V98_8]MDP9689298.1 acyl carrier protein [Pseudomonas mohnii]
MISKEAILEKVIELIKELAPDEALIKPDTDLIQDLGIESIRVMDMLMVLEDEYDISIELNVLVKVRTPEQLAEAILTLTERKYGTV